MRFSVTKIVPTVMAVGVLALPLVACGDESSSEGASTGAAAETGATGNEAGVAAAEAAIRPYIGQPSEFPVVEELQEVPTGASIVYMDSGTPVGAIIFELLTDAAKTMGVEVSSIKAGPAATTTRSAFDSVVASKPDAVIVAGINIRLWSAQAEALRDAGIPVITTGVLDTEPYGITAPQAAENYARGAGKLMADYVTAEFGTDSKIVFYGVPELPFTPGTLRAFRDELEAVCPECSLRTVDIPVATIGNTAPNAIVSDLQANPDTTVAVFGNDETQIGLPQKLQAAGIEVKTLGVGPTPTNLQYIKDGKQTAGLGYDLPVAAWELLDQTARAIAGQELTGPQAEGLTPLQFLTQEDITFDPSKGWTGYPDFAERFAKLWGVEG
jgi:ribose transport system substrate-binding protein